MFQNHFLASQKKTSVKNGLVNNFLVFNACGDLELLMVREKGEQNHDIHKLASDTFKAAAARASELKLRRRTRHFEDCFQRGTTGSHGKRCYA